MSDRHGERNLTAAVQDLAVALERGLGDHPAPGELLDFLAGDLSEGGRERIEDHLALCRACARTALELAGSSELEAAPAGALLTEKELAAEWERFRGALAATPARRTAAMRGVPWALAAGLLLAVVGLGWWVGELAREVRRLSAPRGDMVVADLLPVAARERAAGEDEGEEVPVPAWAERVVLLLALADPGAAAEYRVEIAGADGGGGRQIRGLRRDPDGTLALDLPARMLRPGRYRIRLFTAEGGKPVAEYALRVVPPLSD